MSAKYERTFTVAVPVERAWRAFTDPAELAAWFTPRTEATEARPGERIEFGFSGVADWKIEVADLQPQRLIRYKEGPGVTPGTTEVTVVFEATETGTRITITRAGFGEGDEWLESLQGLTMGMNESIADLILYLETGVSHPRHNPSITVLGLGVHDAPAGVQVYEVGQGTFAEKVGLRPGDILLEMGGAPVFDRRDIAFFTREHGPGEEAEATWVRGGELMRGSAGLSDRASLAASERGELRWM